MTRKFKTAAADPAGPAMCIRPSLHGYIAGYAADVLQPLSIMAPLPPLAFWEASFEPPRPGEGWRRHGDGQRWPYAERLVYLARRFQALDERGRRYILRAAAARIWWRGDDIQQFRGIVAAQQGYRNLDPAQQAAYRRRLLAAAATCRAGHCSP